MNFNEIVVKSWKALRHCRYQKMNLTVRPMDQWSTRDHLRGRNAYGNNISNAYFMPPEWNHGLSGPVRVFYFEIIVQSHTRSAESSNLNTWVESPSSKLCWPTDRPTDSALKDILFSPEKFLLHIFVVQHLSYWFLKKSGFTHCVMSVCPSSKHIVLSLHYYVVTDREMWGKKSPNNCCILTIFPLTYLRGISFHYSIFLFFFFHFRESFFLL